MLDKLTSPQKNMYDTELFFTDSSVCNIGGCIFFDGKADIVALKRAINKLIENADGLRIRLKIENNNPLQYIEEYMEKDIEVIELDDNYVCVIEDLIKKPFKLSEELYDFKIVKINNKIGVYVKLHHIICDAWSAALIISKLVEYYNKIKNNEEIVNDIYLYTKFIENEKEYLKSDKYLKDEEFWKEEYINKPSYVTMSPNKKTNLDVSAGRSSFDIEKEETNLINKYCMENNISVAILFEAIVSIYASRINNANDLTLCSMVINRNGFEEKNTIGMFNNILPLTIPIDYEEDFLSLCQNISTKHYQLFRHQKFPLSNIMNNVREKYGIDIELYDIMVSYQNAQLVTNEDIDAKWVFNNSSDLGFMFNISDMNNIGKLHIDIDWRKNCFNKDDIEKIYYRFINIANQVIENKEIKLKDINIVTPEEEKQILVDFNNTNKEYPKNKCIYKYLEENVIKNPNKVALRFDNKEMTYKEFNEKVNALSNYIASNINGENLIIGVMCERSYEMMIAIYAIIKLGHAYMPIDPHFPSDRIEFMIEDSKTPIILTQTKWKNTINTNVQEIDLDEFDYDKYSKENPNLKIDSNSTAYVIYTSGSTGKPKGAMIPHHSAINRIKWMHEKYPLKDSDVVLQKTPYTFDVSVWELFWWSMYNGTLQILIPEGHKDPKEIIDSIENGKVTHMHFVPSMLNVFLEYLEANMNLLEKLKTLRYVFVSGEALQVEHVKRFYNIFDDNKVTLHNLYGPTECTVDVSYYDCDKNNIPKSIPIGKPVDNTQLLVLDKNEKILPIGVVGELYISGVLVGKGYVNRAELTKEKFVKNTYYPYQTMYKTGDLAMWLDDGNIEYCGRTDFQIKIRGLRVELGDIENAITRYDGINQTVVTVFDLNGEKNLCAYYVSNTDIDISKLKESLLQVLPEYMVPQYYVKLDKMPTNENGKANRKLLPKPEIKQEKIEYIAPTNEFEEIMQKCLQEVLGIDKISCDTDLFNNGLTSLGVISTITKLSIKGYELKVKDFYEHKTIKEIAKLLENKVEVIENYEEDEKLYSNVSDIKEHKLPIKQGDSILLTGATSFLGIHIIQELMKNTNKNIYCLIRNKEKFERFIKKFTNLTYPNDRLICVNGDITKEDLGIDENIVKQIKEEISDIIHCAADVSFFCSWEKSKSTNYIGTCNAIKFAEDSKAKLHHISTMSVSGDILTRQTKEYPKFTEDDLYIGQLYKENVYAHSKYLAEKEVIKNIREDKINASIYRIANLTWRVSDGMFQENYQDNDLYILTKVMLKTNKIPLELLTENLSMSPVDETAKAILRLMYVDNNAIYNIYSENSLNISNYIGAMQKADTIRIKDFRDTLLNDNKEAEYKFVLAYMNEIFNNDVQSIVTFNNNNTNKILKDLNFKWSTLGDEYARMYRKIGGK